MKRIATFLSLSFKLAFLACLSLMNIQISTAAPMPSCHKIAAAEEAKQVPASPCKACIFSENAWSQPFVTAPEILEIIVAEIQIVPADFTVTDERLVTLDFEIPPVPPDDVGATHPELIVKNSTVFVI